MKRYKKNPNPKMELETISAKLLFDLVEKIGEGVHDGYHIYDVTHGDDMKKRWRCDMGDNGSFEVSHYEGEEEWDMINRDWVWVEGDIYRYTSLSSNYNAYPTLPIDKAFDILNK